VGLGFPSDSIESNGNGIVSSGGSKRKRRGLYVFKKVKRKM
jgi:hypothetical protein